MSENTITPISTVGSTAVSGTSLKAQINALGTPKTEVSDQEKSSKQIENEPEQVSTTSSNVSVHFRINDETNELTVFVVDRENKKILRTIPASEFSKLNAGEILQLTA